MFLLTDDRLGFFLLLFINDFYKNFVQKSETTLEPFTIDHV